MFFSPDDDDDFSNSLGSGKSNLSSLFGADQAAFNSSRNESLTYTAPKQPKKQAASTGQETPPAVIHAAVAQTFKFVNGQYASQGKLGVAVLGSHVKKEYRLLVYASKKQQVTNAKITGSFSFVVQANNYASFYDDARLSWSLRFDTEQAVIDFAKQIGLARYNSAPGNLVKQDLQPGDGQAIENGDAIEVKYTGSLWTNNAFGKVFDSNATADKLFKLRPGKGKVIKGWEDGVIGMKKGSKRLLVIPPPLAYGDKGVPSRVPPKSTLLFEVEISRVKFAKEKSDAVSSDTSTPPPVSEQNHSNEVNSSTSSGHSREDEDLRERTASLNKELSSSPEKGSEKAKLLARMSKMGKNVLKIPGAVAADPDEDEPEPAETAKAHKSENVEGQTSARTQAEPIPERSRAHSQDHHEPVGNPHPHSPGKPPIAPRSAHVTRMAHAASAHAPSHVPQTQSPQTQPPQQYHTEFQNPQPTQTQIPPQQQMLALYQSPLQQTPPVYQQPAQFSFPQAQPPFQPVYQQPAQPVFQPAPVVQPAPTVPPTPSSSGGTSDVMMPMLMTESRQHQTEVRQAITKVTEKIDSLEHKIDLLKQTNDDTALRPAVPGVSNENIMEASVLMNSIVKLVQENERMKRENVEKTAKVEGLNEKISELLHRSQRYVEQSNIFLEQRNESLQQTTSYSQSKLVELEREKATLSTELGTYKQNYTTLETELEILRKQDAENRELLKKTSSQLQKNNSELGTTQETLAEKEEEIQKLSSSVKNLKQERKKLEGNLTSFEETVSDLKQEKESLEKSLAERKRKHAEVKKRMDEEIEELKSGHEEELNSLKERHRRELTSSSSSLSHQISQLESEVEEKWQEKSKQMVNQCEKKWERKYGDLVEESESLKRKLAENEEKYSTMKTSQNKHLQEIEDLQEKLKDLDEAQNNYTRVKKLQSERQREIKELRESLKEMENTQKKYQDLRMKSIEMKEKYEQRIHELTEENEMAVKEAKRKISEEKQQATMQREAPEPSRDKIVNEVKQIMNKVFFKIREEFVVGDTYKGSSIISIVLNVIKTMTLKLTSGADESGEESEDESEDEGSEDEESGSEEGEISEKEEEGEISGKEEEGEEKKSGEIGSGKVESEQSEEDESEPADENESIEIQSGKEESGVTESRKEEVKDNEEVQSGSNEEDESEKVDVSGEEVKEEENGKEIQNEECDGRRDPEKGEDEMKVEESVKAEDNGSKTEKGMVMDSDGREGVMKDTEEASEVPEDIVESPLLKYSAGEEEDEDEAEDQLGPPEDTGDDLGTPEGDTDDHLGVMVARNTASSEEDLDNISNRPVLGSEHTSISSGEENEGNNEDRNDQDNDSQEHLVPNLPNIGELSSTNKDMGASEGETKADGNVENTNENDQVENSGKEAEENKVEPDEKNKEEKKVQSLADFLSDDEDDVEGLFDAPALKIKSGPAKKEESPPQKAIPPPLFDDDDDDDLDWFS